jgi:type VI secretion system protein ImpI
MTLRLVVEHSPHRQPRSEVLHVGGDLTIGRAVEVDWPLEDPDMFISRRHCIVSGGDGAYRVTDISRGGVFVDGAAAPLGEGRSADLTHGMRLRLGDVVLRVELETAPAARPTAPQDPKGAAAPAPTMAPAMNPASNPFAADDFFTQPAVHTPPAAPRPASLPDPFDRPARPAFPPPSESRPSSGAPLFDDPFTLDPLPSRAPAATSPHSSDSSWTVDDPFGAAPVVQPMPPAPSHPRPARPEEDRTQPPRDSLPEALAPALRPAATPPPETQHTSPGATAGDPKAALLRGMGLSPDLAAGLSDEDIEAVGRRTRALLEALVHLLRSRAREKQNLRVAQTVISGADVNPLKFLATSDEMMAAMLGQARPGYLDADAAIAGAVRDLADHQLRTWSGLQEALRRMIDRFDPEAIEAEFEEAGRLKAILAGGRSALLWQLYRERYRIIAKAAEDRFLGEVGSDFRDAYEGNKGRTTDDG